MRLAPLLLIGSVVFAGCATQEKAPAPGVPAPVAVTRPPGNQTPAPAAAPTQANKVPTPVVRPDPLDDPKGLLAGRSVFFDFDTSIIQEKDRPLLEGHGRYLGANKGAQVRLEGNTDERGSREYNLALGIRRGEAARTALKVFGATENQIEVVSLGEEKPRAAGHDESAWAENRRVDIVYIRRK